MSEPVEAKKMQEMQYTTSERQQKVLDMRRASLTNGSNTSKRNRAWFQRRERNWAWLLKYPKMGMWLEHFPSDETRNHYGSMLNLLLKEHKITNPDTLLDLSEEEVRQLVRSIAPKYRNEGKLSVPKSIAKAVKSFLGYYDREVRFRWGEFAHPPKRVAYQYVPKNHEVFRLATATKACVKNQLLGARNYAIVVSLWQSGVRNNCIGRWTYRMIKDYLYPEIKGPAILKITSQLDTKLRRFGIGFYYTFLNPEALTAISEYITLRKKIDGWTPEEDDLLFIPVHGGNGRLDRRRVDELIRTGASYAGFKPYTIWPHVLRKSFNRVLLRGGIDLDLREAMMGHKVQGVRGNYWDYHDMEEGLKAYTMCDWSENGSTKIETLEQKLAAQERELAEVRAQLQAKQETENEDQKLLAVIKNFPEFKKLLDALKSQS